MVCAGFELDEILLLIDALTGKIPNLILCAGKFCQEQKRFLSIWAGRLLGCDWPIIIPHTWSLCIFLSSRTKRVYAWSSGMQFSFGKAGS
jgi:hypothetical protein